MMCRSLLRVRKIYRQACERKFTVYFWRHHERHPFDRYERNSGRALLLRTRLCYARRGDESRTGKTALYYRPLHRHGHRGAGLSRDRRCRSRLANLFSKVIARAPVPNVGDELHHFGWNACSSCHGDSSKSRRFMVVPGQKSSRIHIFDTADARYPKLHKVIEPEEIKAKTNLTAPHTVHCLADGHIMISMLGDSEGNGPGGFLLLDENFDIAGRWEHDMTGMNFNYDFWYQPRHNVMVSSEWGAPKTYYPGFDLDDVKAGHYGHSLHFWDWQKHDIIKSVDLGEEGMIPLELRFHHNPDSTHGYVAAALSSNVFHFTQERRAPTDWTVNKVIDVEPFELEGWPFPVPSLITDILLSLDDNYMYFSNWLHGDIRQYDISDPAHPKLTGQVWCGGLLGSSEHGAGTRFAGRAADAATQPGRQAPVRHQLPVQHLGQPVLSRPGKDRLLHAADRLRYGERRHADQRELLCGLLAGTQRPVPRPRDALSRRRCHLRHLDIKGGHRETHPFVCFAVPFCFFGFCR